MRDAARTADASRWRGRRSRRDAPPPPHPTPPPACVHLGRGQRFSVTPEARRPTGWSQGVAETGGSRLEAEEHRGGLPRHPTRFSPTPVSLAYWGFAVVTLSPGDHQGLSRGCARLRGGKGHLCGQSQATAMNPRPGHQALAETRCCGGTGLGRGAGGHLHPTPLPEAPPEPCGDAWVRVPQPHPCVLRPHARPAPDTGGKEARLPHAGFRCPLTTSKTKTTTS